MCIPLLSTSASECDVSRLRCVSLCVLVGVTHTISLIHIVFSKKSLCMLCMIEYIACWVHVLEYVK